MINTKARNSLDFELLEDGIDECTILQTANYKIKDETVKAKI